MTSPTRKLYFGDNLEIMRQHISDSSIDLVYLDPPFNSNQTYNVLFKGDDSRPSQAQIEAFDDTGHWTPDTQSQYERLVTGDAPTAVAKAIDALRVLLGENDPSLTLGILNSTSPAGVDKVRLLDPLRRLVRVSVR